LNSDGLDNSREAEKESELSSVLNKPMLIKWFCQTEGAEMIPLNLKVQGYSIADLITQSGLAI
jgi:hypothetical protein